MSAKFVFKYEHLNRCIIRPNVNTIQSSIPQLSSLVIIIIIIIKFLQLHIGAYGRNFRGAGRSDQCSVTTSVNKKF